VRNVVAAVLALVALLTLPAWAAGWGHYENGRFGFAIDVPPGFVARGESANGDGNRFTTPTAELRAFAGYLVEERFEGEVRTGQSVATDDGFTLTYQVTTPRYAAFSGRKGARVLYERLVAICGTDAFMGFSLEYSVADLQSFKSVIDRLTSSLTPPAKC
jgi:hypothetical protein